MLEAHIEAFAWEYLDMKGIHPNICTYHIYTDDSKPVNQHPRRVNLTFKDIVKIEIEKFFKVKFIFFNFRYQMGFTFGYNF